ncbi:hypothetical protein ACLKA6_006848 [Drosophila palustris]
MKRRWSNNGGFLRIQEESSSEVTSSSNGLVLPSGINMSPSSLDSHDYGEQELWLCGNDASSVYGNVGNGNTLGHGNGNGAQQQSVITVAMHGCSSNLPPQTTIIPINNNNNNTNNNNNNNSNGHYVPGATNLGSLTNGHNMGSLVNGMQQLQNGHNNNNNNNSLINSTTPNNMQQMGGIVGGMSLNSLHHTNGNSNGLGGPTAGIVGSHNNNNNNNNNMGGPMGMAMQHTPRSDSANSISSG